MIVGHYAAALLPYSRLKAQSGSTVPFWLLLLCANVPEFLWLLLALLGIEPASPPSLFDASFKNLQVDMTYSHNLIPGLLQGLIVGVVVLALFRQRALAFWCGVLAAFHVLCDFVVGFEHQLLHADTATISMNTYGTMPQVAILIELAFAVACIAWYQHAERLRGQPVARGKLIALYVVFIVGIAAWLPIADHSVRELLRLVGVSI